MACVFAMTRLSRVLVVFATRSTHPSSQVATSATSCLRTARDQSGSSRKCGGDRYFKPVPENYKCIILAPRQYELVRKAAVPPSLQSCYSSG